jgi:hypothetical protein
MHFTGRTAVLLFIFWLGGQPRGGLTISCCSSSAAGPSGKEHTVGVPGLKACQRAYPCGLEDPSFGRPPTSPSHKLVQSLVDPALLNTLAELHICKI